VSAQDLFHPPVQVKVGGVALASQSPGYACPTMVDLDGDGLLDLVSGQFMKGKMMFLKNVGEKGKPKFENIDWVKGKNGQPLQVPGVF